MLPKPPLRSILFVLALLLPASLTVASEFRNYLDPPRVTFAGRFFANPSTLNNDPSHYEEAEQRPSPWQEPGGEHYWRLVDCRVRSALGPEGERLPDDPLLGAAVTGTDDPTPAKLVDLDVYQQMTSTIYGFVLSLPMPAGGELHAKMDPAILNSAWMGRVLPTRGWQQDYGWGSFGGDANICGVFQTLLRVPDESWPAQSGSPVLDALREASDVVDGMRLISFRFVTDGYFNVPHHKDYRYGRITGCLGPGSAEGPRRTPGHRWLNPRPLPPDAAWYVPKFYGAPFKIDEERGKLVLDLANALGMDYPGGPPVDLGAFEAVVHDADGATVKLGRVDVSEFVYEDLSAIIELDLDAEAMELLSSRPLFLTTSRGDIGGPILFSESPDGLHYAADLRILRMTSEPGSPGQEQNTRVHVTRWGKPVEGVDFRLRILPVTSSTPGNSGLPGSPGDSPQAWDALAGKIASSDEDGFAEMTLRVIADPGMRTPELDGQLYFVYAMPGGGEWTTPVAPGQETQENQVSVLAWSRHEVKQLPTWEDVVAIMAPYVKLYPAMKDIIDLSDHHSFEVYALNPSWMAYGEEHGYNVDGISAGTIPYMMTRDFEDPRFMPVTRDLSPGRTKTVLNWIKNAQQGIWPTPPPPEAQGSSAPAGRN